MPTLCFCYVVMSIIPLRCSYTYLMPTVNSNYVQRKKAFSERDIKRCFVLFSQIPRGIVVV